jgi:hypothetical protein
MSKHKKKKGDEWTIFVNKIFSRKRANRSQVIPTDYLLALADKIHRINPTKAIVFNTLKEVYCVTYDNAYQKCLDDNKFFKDKQAKHLKEDWNKMRDSIEDLIHPKVQTNK